MRLPAAGLRALLPLLALAACDEPDSSQPDVTPPVEEQLAPAPPGLRKLTAHQYIESIRMIFGDAAAAEAQAPIDTSLNGLDAIGSATHTVTPTGVETYETSARRIAAVVMSNAQARGRVFVCEPTGADDTACFTQIAEELGHLVWRRPLEPEEIDRLVGVARFAADERASAPVTPKTEPPGRDTGGKDAPHVPTHLITPADAGVTAMVTMLLQAPDFLYQVEIGDAVADEQGKHRLTPNELASRMSFFLLGRAPDLALLDVAESGALEDEADIRAIAEALLEQPQARTALRQFYEEILGLRTIMEVEKDPETFPEFTDATRAAIAEETLTFIEEIVWNLDADARDMFDANFTFLNKDTAWIYGKRSDAAAFEKITVEGRFGLLSQPSFLAKNARPRRTSPTLRGLSILSTFLCDDVPPPPPGVPAFDESEEGKPQTMRQKLSEHAKDGCLSCHERTDSLGFALEHFDAVGVYRDKDQGLEIDDADQLNGFGEFDGLEGLAARLREHEDVPICMARQLFRQSMGHLETDGEEPALLAIDEAFANGGYSIRGLLIEIAASPAFRFVGGPR